MTQQQIDHTRHLISRGHTIRAIDFLLTLPVNTEFSNRLLRYRNRLSSFNYWNDRENRVDENRIIDIILTDLSTLESISAPSPIIKPKGKSVANILMGEILPNTDYNLDLCRKLAYYIYLCKQFKFADLQIECENALREASMIAFNLLMEGINIDENVGFQVSKEVRAIVRKPLEGLREKLLARKRGLYLELYSLKSSEPQALHKLTQIIHQMEYFVEFPKDNTSMGFYTLLMSSENLSEALIQKGIEWAKAYAESLLEEE